MKKVQPPAMNPLNQVHCRHREIWIPGMFHLDKKMIDSFWLGRVPYREALELQLHYLRKVRTGRNSVVMWLEHPPTITLGRSAHNNHIVTCPKELDHLGIEVVAADRGGDVTFHGPGQLVVYPILDLSPWNHDIPLYVRMLEEAVIRFLMTDYRIRCSRLAGYPGIWAGMNKICAIGVKANRYIGSKGFIMTHGIALNVNIDLTYFSHIVPCGIQGKSVTSIQKETGIRNLTLEEVLERMKVYFEEVFQIGFRHSKMEAHHGIVAD